ncbi:hypothetical protein ACFLQ2_01040 [archaeon]
MKKTHFLGAAVSISIIAGLLSFVLLSGIGFSIGGVLSPAFYDGLMGMNIIMLILGLVFLGVSMGALFSATRFLAHMRALGLAAITSLIVALIGSVFYWQQMTSYTIVALAFVAGITAAGFLSSKARGTKFSVGFEHAGKAMLIMAIVACVGTLIVVTVDAKPYEDQFIEGITGIAVIDVDEATVEQMVRAENPKMDFNTFLAQLASGYPGYTLEDQQKVEQLYSDYEADYEAEVARSVQETMSTINESKEASSTLIRSTSYFELMYKYISVSYGLAMLLLLGLSAIVSAPVAGGVSTVLHRPLPKAAHPQPKEKAPAVWEEEKAVEQHKKLEELEDQAMGKK